MLIKIKTEATFLNNVYFQSDIVRTTINNELILNINKWLVRNIVKTNVAHILQSATLTNSSMSSHNRRRFGFILRWGHKIFPHEMSH